MCLCVCVFVYVCVCVCVCARMYTCIHTYMAMCVYVCVCVFCNNMTQEILMDITDVEGDKRAQILTLPVLLGPKIALMIALAFLAGAAVSPLVLSVLPNVNIMRDLMDDFFSLDVSFLSMRSDGCSADIC